MCAFAVFVRRAFVSRVFVRRDCVRRAFLRCAFVRRVRVRRSFLSRVSVRRVYGRCASFVSLRVCPLHLRYRSLSCV